MRGFQETGMLRSSSPLRSLTAEEGETYNRAQAAVAGGPLATSVRIHPGKPVLGETVGSYRAPG